MKPYTFHTFDKFKAICSGRGCSRKPTKVLKIKHINKVGNFCETCAADLLNAGLVEEDLMSIVDQ